MHARHYPLARTSGLVVRDVDADGETLVFDTLTQDAYCLDAAVAAVWSRCDGQTSVEDLAAVLGPDAHPKMVWVALEQLRSMGLIVPETLGANEFHGLSRREMLKRIGVGAALAAPLIFAVKVPAVAAASSTCVCQPPGTGGNNSAAGCPCQGNNDCCAVCGGSQANPICGGNIKPAAAACCTGLTCLPPGSGQNNNPAGCPCQGNNDCCAVCGGSQANPICGGNIKPGAPSVCFNT